MEYYYGPNDYNKIFYYNTSNETVDQINTILNDADKLLSLCGAEYDDVTEYQLLVRCLSEQTVVEEAMQLTSWKPSAKMVLSLLTISTSRTTTVPVNS